MTGEENISKVLRMSPDFRWEGVADAPYKKTAHVLRDVKRRVLIGERGETPHFHVRYFEVAPGGSTDLERHEHEHVVIGMRGAGEVDLAGEPQPVGFGDVVYVRPDDPHRFRNPHDEPFGFLCIVNAERDRPRPLEEGADGPGACET